MSPNFIPAASLLLLLLLSSSAAAFNITRLLDRYDGFKTFNDLLTQTELYKEINHRQTITVLAVNDDAISGIAGKPTDVVKRILSNHVVLDYYDIQKLKNLKKGTTLLTTLYQTTGVASYQQGFLNVTVLSNGNIAFGSAVKGANLDVTLTKLVASQPFNISVLEVSGPIVAPGIDATPNGPTPAPKKSHALAPAPLKKKHAAAPSPVEEEVVAEAPISEAPSSSDAPASSPTEADAPAADAAADVEKAPAPAKSSASRHFGFSFGFGLVLMLVVAFFAQ